VLVVGETARSKNFSLNGYERDTNPELAKRDVLSWRNARSCGTSTRESVPCMFSNLGREGFYASKVEHDNLLDVLQAAGLAVLWVDNQAGCKGVCKRIPMADTADSVNTPAGKALCAQDGECLDALLLSGLDERIAKLDPARRARAWFWSCTRWAVTAPSTSSAPLQTSRLSSPSAPPMPCPAARSKAWSMSTTTPFAIPTTSWPRP
jgi:hypothetical protein